MRRKEVTRRLTSSAEVRAAVHAHREGVGRQLDERPASPAEAAYSQAYFDHMESELATVEGDLVVAEDDHVRKQIQTSQAQEASDQLASSVYDKQTSARQVLMGLYGPEHQFKLAATSGNTPQGPMTLPEQVDQTVKLLRTPEAEPPAAKVGGVNVNFGIMADDLESDLGQYRSFRTELDRRRKEGDATRLATNKAIEAFDRVFPWVASSLEGTFRLVGERELAERIRTSLRRVTRRQADPREEQTASPEPSPDGQAPEATESVPTAAEDVPQPAAS